MSDTKKEYKAPRPHPENGSDYQRLCTTAGDLQYKIDVFKRDLAMVNEQLRDLNFEALAVQQSNAEAAAKKKAEDEAKAKSEEAKPPTDNVVALEPKKEG